MSAPKRSSKKRTISRKKTSNLKMLLAPFLVIAGIAIFLSFTLLNPSSFQSVASGGDWEEIVSTPSAGMSPQGGGPILQSIATYTKTSQSVVDTGVWNGRQVKVVKDSGFTSIFKSGGIYSINALADGRLFMGGISGFAIKYPDSSWSAVYEYAIDQQNQSKVGVVTRIVPVAVASNDRYPDVYMQTNNGVIRSTSTFSPEPIVTLVLNPSDPFGYLRNVSIVASANTGGVAAFSGSRLYFTESGDIRQWQAPRRLCNGIQYLNDEIRAAFYDPYAQKTSFFVKECQDVYLYDMQFDSALSVPLVVTKVARISNFPSQNGEYQIEAGKESGNLYLTAKFSRDMFIIKNYRQSSSPLSFIKVSAPTQVTKELGTVLYPYNTFDIEEGRSDTVWANPAADTQSWFTGTDLTGTPSYLFGDNSISANTYTNAITVMQKDKYVYVSHKYLPGQFKSGLITIIGDAAPLPTLTPTSTPAVKLCKATVTYMYIHKACKPAKAGSNTTIDFGCSNGQTFSKTPGTCSSKSVLTSVAENECRKYLSPCR